MRIANNSVTIEHISTRFLEYYKDSSLTKKQVKQVMYLFNKILSRLVIETGYKYKLPHKLGYLSVVKRKMGYHKLYFDFDTYNKTGLKTYHTNDHSDGWYANSHWQKKSCRVINKTWYSFKFTRHNQRLLASIMKKEQGHQIYREWN